MRNSMRAGARRPRAACAVASAWPMASSRRGAGRSSPRGSVSRRPDRFRSIPARWPWGRGIATTLAQLCAAHFGVAAQAVQVRAGDTAFVSHGMGGFASRQAMMAGSAVTLAAGRVRARPYAAPPRCWASRRTACCWPMARSRRRTAGRSRWRGWPPCGRACRDTRCRVATIPAGRDRAFPLRRAILRRRLACLRGRGRSRHRGGASAALRGGARQRPHHQSRAGRRPGPRRRGARHWQRPVRVDGL